MGPDRPASQLIGMLTGAWVAQALCVAAQLGIADELQLGPKSSEALAETTHTDASALYRLLRTLASVGVFAEGEDRAFGLTPLAELLRSNTPNSLRAFAIMLGAEWHWRTWGEALYSVRTGRPAFDSIFGTPVFEYYAEHPDAARVASEGLASRSRLENTAIVAAYEFGVATSIVDVGGGQGALLLSILGANPGARGLLFERSQVIAMARSLVESAGGAARCDLVPGDFFTSVPAGHDVYLLKKVIHDWDDERAGMILRNCRVAMRPGARLLVLETVVPSGNEPSFAKLLDLLMLVYAGGRERTAGEYRELLGSAGFQLRRVLPTASGLSVLEAVPL